MKKILMVVALGLVSLHGWAQQDPMLSQYMFNQLLINPAYAGSKDYASASLLYRDQWAAFKGAPNTLVGSLQGPLASRKVGLGLDISADKIGVTSQYDIYANYAYHIPITDKLKLGLGLRGGITYFSYDNKDLILWDANDASFPATQSNWLPNFGAGAFLYSKKFYAGLSVPELLSYDASRPLSLSGEQSLNPEQVRHYFATVGGAIELSDNFALRPSALIKYTENAPLEFDLDMNVLIHRVLWLGVAYRTGDAVIGIIEVQATKQLRIGYSYDFTVSGLTNSTTEGSHEIMIGYDFGYDIQKMKTPRYF